LSVSSGELRSDEELDMARLFLLLVDVFFNAEVSMGSKSRCVFLSILPVNVGVLKALCKS
jgi:hypothetical protein